MKIDTENLEANLQLLSTNRNILLNYKAVNNNSQLLKL
jgi:hypothetical protein